MARREQIKRPVPQETKPAEEVDAQVDAEAEKLKAETDALLDEIDGLLEENAEEFVKGFIQKGGQ